MFNNVANMTLARRDTYLAHVKAGIKQDILSAPRQAPLHLSTLFPDHLLKKAEEDIAQHENKESFNSHFLHLQERTLSPLFKVRHTQRTEVRQAGLENHRFIQPEKEGKVVTALITSGQGSVFL